jgi:hypothetical protein
MYSKEQFFHLFNHLECIHYTHHTETENGKRFLSLIFSGNNETIHRVILELPQDLQKDDVKVDVTCQYDLDGVTNNFAQFAIDTQFYQY